MSTTQTITGHAVIPLSEIPMSPLATAPTTPAVERAPRPEQRVFEVAPTAVLSRWTRFLITFLIIMANLVQFVTNFTTMVGAFALSKELGRNVGPGEANWMPASYSLAQSAFVLISGRLGAVYGHQRVLLIGGAVLTVFSLVNAFCTSYAAFVTARALSGVGGGLIMPNAVACITIMVPPGRDRNILLGFFAASAPVGGYLGGIIAGVFIKYTEWKWIFIFMAIIGVVVFGGLFLLSPPEMPVDRDGKIDYVGAAMGLSSLLLFNFVWNQAPSAGWNAPYEITCLIVSVVLFIAFIIWEQKFVSEPIMPMAIFRRPGFAALVSVVLLTYMSFGIWLWYMLAWQELIRGWTVLEMSVGFSPFALGATIAVFLGAWLIPRLAAQWIMAIGVLTVLLSNLLLSTMPAQQTYWAQTFISIVLGSICPDFVYVAAQIIASNSVSRRHQGVAGSLIGTLNLYGNSLGLGFAGTIEIEVHKRSWAGDDVAGYRAALYFGIALAAVALVLDFAFVRMPKEEREGWGDEDAMADRVDDDYFRVGAVVPGTTTAVDGISQA